MLAVEKRMGRDRVLVNRWLERALVLGPEVPGRLAQAMRYAVLGPGKRIRPVFCLAAFRAAGGRRAAWAAPFCCGIEMLHAFSLAHDDLPSMDNDDFRRGRPSLHRRFDEATAILAADALFALAFQSFAGSQAPAERKVGAIGEIARSVGPAGMAGGQMLDIGVAEGRTARGGTMARVHRMKTAEFIAASLACGALIAGANGRLVGRVRAAGRVLGELFQITDDILDAQGANEGTNAVRLAGPASVRRQAELEAARAERMFRALGSGFDDLAGFPQMILERRR